MPPRKKIPRKQAPSTGYWHGGPSGLQVNDVILPASELSHMPGFYAMAGYADADPNRVYLTTSPLIAEVFAALCIDWSHVPPARVPGAVYEVEPIGTLEQDPDYPGSGCHFSCDRARIVAVTKSGIREASRAARLASMPYTTWDDGTPMYDAQGYALPPVTARLLGVEPQHLRGLGFGPNARQIDALCMTIMLEHGISTDQITATRERVLAEQKRDSQPGIL